MSGTSLALHLPLAAALTVGLVGCDCNKESGEPIVWLDGLTDGTQYQSTALDERWLAFPGGRRYRLVHGLGRIPHEVHAYLAFDDTPQDFSAATGNSALFEEVTAEYLDIHNDACPDYYVRVVASGPLPDDPL